MPLRAIDNALPKTTPERPKKQAKVVTTDRCGVNDENKVPCSQVTIDYVASENLEAMSDPESKIQSVTDGLEAEDWTKVCESLNNARRLALHHSTLLRPSLEKVMVVIVKAMKNPRSALCKTSIMASSDVFKSYGDELLMESSPTCAVFDQLLLQLLMKASQDKRFVCEEAEKTLRAMVESISSGLLLHKLRTYACHANPRVRAKAALSISLCVSKMGVEVMEQVGLVPLLQLGAQLLNDRLPEAREAARSLIIALFHAFTQSQQHKLEAWQSFCDSNLTPFQALSVLKSSPMTTTTTQ